MKLFALLLTAMLSLNLAGYPPAMLTPEFLALLGNDQVLADRMNPDRAAAIRNYLGERFVQSRTKPDQQSKIIYALTGDDNPAVEAGFYERFLESYELVFIDCTLEERKSLESLADSLIEAARGTEFDAPPGIAKFVVRPDLFLKKVIVQLSSADDKTIARFKEIVSDDERLVFEEIPIEDGGLYPEDYGDVEEATPDDALAAE